MQLNNKYILVNFIFFIDVEDIIIIIVYIYIYIYIYIYLFRVFLNIFIIFINLISSMSIYFQYIYKIEVSIYL